MSRGGGEGGGASRKQGVVVSSGRPFCLYRHLSFLDNAADMERSRANSDAGRFYLAPL